jgi:hypothetical protein
MMVEAKDGVQRIWYEGDVCPPQLFVLKRKFRPFFPLPRCTQDVFARFAYPFSKKHSKFQTLFLV